MIYIFTALYYEAHIFIEQFHMKKIMGNTRFQQFTSESGQVLLTVSGVGGLAAACAVSSVCTQYPPQQNDFLLNAGICAGIAKQKDIFLIHKLTEYETGKTFYPDMLYRHEFQEAELVTGMVPWRQSRDGGMGVPGKGSERKSMDGNAGRVYLYDMEGAAVYQAGAYFFGPHQMVFLKIISDSGEGDRLSGECIQRLMEMHKDDFGRFLKQILQITQDQNRLEKQTMTTQAQSQPVPPGQEDWLEQWIRRLCADLHCSRAMEDSLRQHIRYAVLAGIDYRSVVQKLYRENRLPCRDKREGKHRFEELKQRLL